MGVAWGLAAGGFCCSRDGGAAGWCAGCRWGRWRGWWPRGAVAWAAAPGAAVAERRGAAARAVARAAARAAAQVSRARCAVGLEAAVVAPVVVGFVVAVVVTATKVQGKKNIIGIHLISSD